MYSQIPVKWLSKFWDPFLVPHVKQPIIVFVSVASDDEDIARDFVGNVGLYAKFWFGSSVIGKFRNWKAVFKEELEKSQMAIIFKSAHSAMSKNCRHEWSVIEEKHVGDGADNFAVAVVRVREYDEKRSPIFKPPIWLKDISHTPTNDWLVKGIEYNAVSLREAIGDVQRCINDVYKKRGWVV